MSVQNSNPPPSPVTERPAPTPPPPPPPTGTPDSFGTTLSSDLEEAVVHLCQHAKFLSRGQREKLRSALLIVDPTAPHVPNQHDLNYDASFDLGSEVSAQIKAVRAIRSYVFDAKGNIRDGITSREAKEVISSGSTMLASLMKYHKDVMNMDRLRMLEQAVVEALQEYDPELREQVLKTLEEKLEIEDE